MRLRLSLVAIAFIALLLVPQSIEAQVTQYDLFLGANGPITVARPTGTDYIDSQNLTVSYDMETLISSQIQDFSGEGNHGTITGAVDANGVFGRARDFDGSDDFINMNYDLPNSNFSLVSWVNPDDLSSSSYRTILSKRSGAGTINEWSFFVAPSGSLGFTGWNSGGGVEVSASGGTLSVGNWSHVVATWDAPSFTITIFLNGDSVDSDVGTAPLRDAGSPVAIGRDIIDVVNPDRAWNGSVDEVLIFNDTLTPNEVEILSDIGYDYTYTSLEPRDAVGMNWIGNASQSWGANTLYNFSQPDLLFTANETVWVPDAISWDSYSNVTDTDIGFNFTMPIGAYPYWVNDTLQGNLTTVAGAIDFNWTDWIDGEHLFELGFEIISEPTELTGVEGDIFTYDADSSKTNVTWSLETGPSWIFVSPTTGLVAGVMEPGGFVIVIAVTSSGIERTQSFALVVTPSPNDEIILIMLPIILGLFVVAPIFNLPTLWMLDGILTILFGIWTFNELGFPFYFAVGIMTFGGILLMGGIVYALTMRGMLGKREKT